MKSHSPNQNQKHIFQPLLDEFINPKDELVILSKKIEWSFFEKEFEHLYSKTGSPAKPIRLMIGLMILRRVYNFSDERVVEEWVKNPYYQYFCGEDVFKWTFPCDPTDLVYFRKRIGTEGVEKILAISISLHGKDAQSKEVCIDSTAQEKNITFPTDAKLYRKVISKCNKIANDEGITQRQSYKRTVKKNLLKLRFAHHPKRKKEARKAQRKLKTIAGRLIRELERKLSLKALEDYHLFLETAQRIITQKRTSKNKVYSLHEPDVACIAKGKSHKPYEFGSKVSFAVSMKNVIVSAVSFQGNPHDSKTLEKTIEQYERLQNRKPAAAILDRGYPGKKEVLGVKLIRPDKPNKASTIYEKQKARKRFRRRAGIEPVISHVKHHHRMLKNYLKGIAGDEINAVMGAAGFNFKSLLRKIKAESLFFICKIKNYIKIIFGFRVLQA